MTAKVVRLDDHVLDADILTNEIGAWFAHDHEHHHQEPDADRLQHSHRHDHRRCSHRGDYDHHHPLSNTDSEYAP